LALALYLRTYFTGTMAAMVAAAAAAAAVVTVVGVMERVERGHSSSSGRCRAWRPPPWAWTSRTPLAGAAKAGVAKAEIEMAALLVLVVALEKVVVAVLVVLSVGCRCAKSTGLPWSS